MSTAAAPELRTAVIGGSRHFLLRRLHSLTGILFGAYVIFHLFINATLIQGGEIYQAQVDKIHLLPFVTGIEWVFIYLPIIFHTVYGSWIIVTGQPNNASYPYFKNLFYLLQRISAVVLAAFIAFHVLAMKGMLGRAMAFDAAHATASTVRSVGSHWFVAWVVYPLGVLAAAFHTANGFWTAGVSWGLTISAGAQRRWGRLCAVVFFGMTVVGLLAVAATIAGI